MEIRDQESGQGIDWSTMFFRLHHYCNLNKFEIFEYTLPQVAELMRMVGKHIQFEVQIKTSSLGMFGGGAPSSADSSEAESGDYEEINEDGINDLAKILGGGL